MDIELKGLNIFGIIITTKKAIGNAKLSVEPKEVYFLFRTALNEQKIVINSKLKTERENDPDKTPSNDK